MKVAVYGSLKKGYGNHGVMKEANGKYLCTTTTKENDFIMNGYGYPYVVRDKNNSNKGKVEVEVYEVENIDPLDWLEGHPTFYKREQVELDNGEKAWMYIYQNDIEPDVSLLKNGVYVW